MVKLRKNLWSIALVASMLLLSSILLFGCGKPDYVVENVYYQAQMENSYFFVMFREDNVSFIQNIENLPNEEYATSYSISSKDIKDDKWHVVAEIDNPSDFQGPYTAELKIIVESKENFSLTLVSSEGKDVMTLNFEKLNA